MESRRIEELIGQPGGSNVYTRQRPREALAAIGESALVPLLESLESSQACLRRQASRIVTDTLKPAAMPSLPSTLADSESGVRWLAALALTNMGVCSIPPMLQGLIGHAGSKGFRDASHHVLNYLSERNTVLQDIREPVPAVPGDTDAAEIISSRAEVALHELRTLSRG